MGRCDEFVGINNHVLIKKKKKQIVIVNDNQVQHKYC